MSSRTAPEHGTWQRYVYGAAPCRDTCCRGAWRAYQNNRTRQIAYGRHNVQRMVDATPAREHIAALRADYGLGLREISKLGGFGKAHIEHIADGSRTRVQQRTLDRILALTVDLDALPDTVLVDSTGTRRRLQGLVAAGWTIKELGRQLGCTHENVRCLLTSERTLVGTRRRVIQLVDRLWMQQPPSANGAQRGASRLARKRAAENGWPVLLAWDDETIDDPAAEPHDVTRTGQRSSVDVAAELEDLLDVVDPGITAEQASARLGYRDAQSVYLALKRANRSDLRARLDRNNEAANPTPLVTKADAYGRKPSRKDTAA